MSVQVSVSSSWRLAQTAKLPSSSRIDAITTSVIGSALRTCFVSAFGSLIFRSDSRVHRAAEQGGSPVCSQWCVRRLSSSPDEPVSYSKTWIPYAVAKPSVAITPVSLPPCLYASGHRVSEHGEDAPAAKVWTKATVPSDASSSRP